MKLSQRISFFLMSPLISIREFLRDCYALVGVVEAPPQQLARPAALDAEDASAPSPLWQKVAIFFRLFFVFLGLAASTILALGAKYSVFSTGIFGVTLFAGPVGVAVGMVSLLLVNIAARLLGGMLHASIINATSSKERRVSIDNPELQIGLLSRDGNNLEQEVEAEAATAEKSRYAFLKPAFAFAFYGHESAKKALTPTQTGFFKYFGTPALVGGFVTLVAYMLVRSSILYIDPVASSVFLFGSIAFILSFVANYVFQRIKFSPAAPHIRAVFSAEKALKILEIYKEKLEKEEEARKIVKQEEVDEDRQVAERKAAEQKAAEEKKAESKEEKKPEEKKPEEKKGEEANVKFRPVSVTGAWGRQNGDMEASFGNALQQYAKDALAMFSENVTKQKAEGVLTEEEVSKITHFAKTGDLEGYTFEEKEALVLNLEKIFTWAKETAVDPDIKKPFSKDPVRHQVDVRAYAIVTAISLAVCLTLLFSIVTGGVVPTSLGMGLSTAITAFFGMLAWTVARRILNRTSAGPYGTLAMFFGIALVAFATLSLLFLQSAVSNLAVAMGGAAAGAFSLFAISAYAATRYAKLPFEARQNQRAAFADLSERRAFIAKAAFALFVATAIVSLILLFVGLLPSALALGVVSGAALLGFMLMVPPYHRAKWSLIALKLFAIAGFAVLAFATSAVLFNFTNVGVFSNLSDLVTAIIFEALPFRSVDVGFAWLRIFSVAALAVSIFGILALVNNLSKSSLSNKEDQAKGEKRFKALTIAAVLGLALVFLLLPYITPDSIVSSNPALFNTGMLKIFAVIVSAIPFLAGNTDIFSKFDKFLNTIFPAPKGLPHTWTKSQKNKIYRRRVGIEFLVVATLVTAGILFGFWAMGSAFFSSGYAVTALSIAIMVSMGFRWQKLWADIKNPQVAAENFVSPNEKSDSKASEPMYRQAALLFDSPSSSLRVPLLEDSASRSQSSSFSSSDLKRTSISMGAATAIVDASTAASSALPAADADAAELKEEEEKFKAICNFKTFDSAEKDSPYEDLPDPSEIDRAESYKIRIVSLNAAIGFIFDNDPDSQRTDEPFVKATNIKKTKLQNLLAIGQAQVDELKKIGAIPHETFIYALQAYQQKLIEISGFSAKQIAIAESLMVWQKKPPRPIRSKVKIMNDAGIEFTSFQVDAPVTAPLTTLQKEELLRIHHPNDEPAWFAQLPPFAKRVLQNIVPKRMDGSDRSPDSVAGYLGDWKDYEKWRPTTLREIPGEANAWYQWRRIEDSTGKVCSETVSRRQGVPNCNKMPDREEQRRSARENIRQMVAEQIKKQIKFGKRKKDLEQDWGLTPTNAPDLECPILFNGLVTEKTQSVWWYALLEGALKFVGLAEDNNQRMAKFKAQAVDFLTPWMKGENCAAFNINTGINRYRDNDFDFSELPAYQSFLNHIKGFLAKVAEVHHDGNFPPDVKKRFDRLTGLYEQLQLFASPRANIEGRSRALHISGLCRIATRLMCGISTGNCKSSKDRDGTADMYAESMQRYFVLYGEEYHYDTSETQRHEFIKRFGDVYQEGQQNASANANSPGSRGLKGGSIFDPDVRAELKNRGIYDSLNEIADFNKPGTVFEKRKKIYWRVAVGLAILIAVLFYPPLLLLRAELPLWTVVSAVAIPLVLIATFFAPFRMRVKVPGMLVTCLAVLTPILFYSPLLFLLKAALPLWAAIVAPLILISIAPLVIQYLQRQEIEKVKTLNIDALVPKEVEGDLILSADASAPPASTSTSGRVYGNPLFTPGTATTSLTSTSRDEKREGNEISNSPATRMPSSGSEPSTVTTTVQPSKVEKERNEGVSPFGPSDYCAKGLGLSSGEQQ